MNNHRICWLLWMLSALLSLLVLPVRAQLQDMKFQPLGNLSKAIPINEINTLYQDRQGFVWIGGGNGLYRYDGHHVLTYRNTPLFPHLLPSNEIACLQDDDKDRLWIGTREGLCRMNLRDGSTRSYHFTEFDNSNAVKCLLFTSDRNLWVGTEGGLYRYVEKTDSFVFLCDKNGNSKVPHASITTLLEDHQGYVWIGTWDKGLYRYNPADKVFYEMPTFNALRSAQTVYESNGVLWVGTWGCGLYKITNPYDTGKPLSFTAYTRANTGGQLASDIVWRIDRDQNTGLLWVGTSGGLTFVEHPDSPGCLLSALPAWLNPEPDYFGKGAMGFFCDRDNQMWAIASQRGVVMAQSRPMLFNQRLLPAPYLYSDYITTLEALPDGSVWVGLRSNGILIFPPDKKASVRHIPMPSQVCCIAPMELGKMLVGTEHHGLSVVADGQVTGQLNRDNAPYLADNCVYSLAQDRQGNWLIGTYRGLSVRYANGKGVHVEGKHLGVLANAQVRDVACGVDGRVWLATRNDGVLCLKGDIRRPSAMTLRQYNSLGNTELDLHYVYRLLVDHRNRVWACSKELGLLIYSPETDSFVSANSRYGLPDEEVYSIEESADGNLWVAMRNELICLMFNDKGETSGMRTYQRHAVVGDQYFGYGLSSANSSETITFGCNNGFVSFPEVRPKQTGRELRPVVTDVLVDGVSVSQMAERDRQGVSELLPPYATTLTLCPSQRELTLQFSSFGYDEQECPRFSYRLDGYDRDWVYPEASQSQVSYSNLPSGTYTFRLRCTDEAGQWREAEQVIRVTVLAPFYLRWYAWLFYALLLGGAVYMMVRYFKNKSEAAHQLQLAHMENRNIEQLNHKKLQFFTNITHDLMTPLTIISATISQLGQVYPEAKADFRTINSNVNRLMRLLQQILEFRKTETGNQHLRVSWGCITDFVRGEVESIKPLTYKKNIHLSLTCQPERLEGYFDSDKLDKILYNLISNATKYNHPEGHIWVTLNSDDGRVAVIRVRDDGAGIAASKLPSLFQRFYEGEHRKFNTYGMGIGLSLVKELTALHHGTVAVESEEGKGSTFTVTLPVNREAFEETEIEDSRQMMIDSIGKQQEAAPQPADDKVKATILVVEDNEELLLMLERLLSPTYRVLTAYNGREALEVIDNEAVDLVLTDVMMPVMDGIEMTHKLRGRQDALGCPVIMLTAKHDDEARAEAYQAGADAYITKPFNTSVLLVRIQNLLSHKEKTDREICDRLFGGIRDVKLYGSDQDFLDSCIKVVQQHIANADFDLPTFAQQMNTSKSTLYKKLRMLTGLSTSAFIRSIRMKSASELLLKNPEAHIADIAYAVGYNDPKYFSSCFKKDFGCLPSEYVVSKKKSALSSKRNGNQKESLKGDKEKG